MKKLLIVLMLLFCLTGCYEEPCKIRTISAEKAIEMYNNKQTFVLEIGEDDCPSCQEYRQTIQQMIDEYNIDVYFVNTIDQDEDSMNDLIYNYLYQLVELPSTYLVVDGESKDYKIGILEYDVLTGWLKSYEFIGN